MAFCVVASEIPSPLKSQLQSEASASELTKLTDVFKAGLLSETVNAAVGMAVNGTVVQLASKPAALLF
ncbi:hypothetical protein DSECCO2_561700 [anaerobic digester metagenome]